MRDGAVGAVSLQDGRALSAEVYALCTPFAVTRTWLQDSLYQADPELGNLHFLEAQLMAALETARQILVDYAATAPLPVVQVPSVWPRALLVAARIFLIPVVAIARLLAWLEEHLSPHRPDASEVRRKATPKLQRDARPPRQR